MPDSAGPWLSLLAIGLSSGALGVWIKGWFERRGVAAKAAVDEAAADKARIDGSIEPLERVIAVQQQQLVHQQAQLDRQQDQLDALRRNYGGTQEKLDTALDRLAMLRAENREWAEYHLAVQRHLSLSAAARAHGEQEPRPPEPPAPRTEFTRRSDPQPPPV